MRSAYSRIGDLGYIRDGNDARDALAQDSIVRNASDIFDEETEVRARIPVGKELKRQSLAQTGRILRAEVCPVSTLYDDEGFLIDWNIWNEVVAGDIARKQFGIDLTEKHWKCIRFVREYYAKWLSLPMVKTIRETTGLTSDEFERLFKRGPSGARGVLCKICGLPRMLCIAAGC